MVFFFLSLNGSAGVLGLFIAGKKGAKVPLGDIPMGGRVGLDSVVVVVLSTSWVCLLPCIRGSVLHLGFSLVLFFFGLQQYNSIGSFFFLVCFRVYLPRHFFSECCVTAVVDR